MVCTRIQRRLDRALRHLPLHLLHNQRRRRALSSVVILAAVTAAYAAIDNAWNRLHPEPYHTSILSGSAWLQELLNGHRDRMKDNLAVRPTVFRRLEEELVVLGGLQSRRYVDVSEQLAIFLYQAVTNNSIRKTAERFQRSNETISRQVSSSCGRGGQALTTSQIIPRCSQRHCFPTLPYQVHVAPEG